MDREQAHHLLALAQTAQPELSGAQPDQWMARLAAQHDDLRAALDWLVDHGEGSQALALAAALWRFWFLGGHVAEGRAALTAALAAPGAEPPTASRATALYGAGLLAFVAGDNLACRALSEESLAVARTLGDREAEVDALVGLARAALRDGTLAAVRTYSEEGVTIARATGSRRALSGPLHMLAAVTLMDGQYEQARVLYEDSRALAEELGDTRGVVLESINLAAAERHLGHLDRATALLREGLQAAYAQGGMGVLPACILGLGAVAAVGGATRRAARLLAASEAQYVAGGVTLDPDDRQTFEQSVALTRAGLPEADFQAAWAHGQALTMDRAVAEALHETESA